MCCGDGSRSLSRLSICAGLLSLVTLVSAVLSTSWLYTREPISLPAGSPGVTTVTFRIGLWRACPSLKRVTTSPSTLLPSPGCQLIQYSSWQEVKEADLGIFWSSLEFTPSFVTKMRYAMPLVVLALALIGLATLFALLGHCHSDLKTLVACGLYTLGGLMLASGLVVFVSVLSDVYISRRQLEYRYGWSFHAAAVATVLAEVAALVSISAYLRRFSSVEDMVRAVVPGADRKLRHHQLCKENRRRKDRSETETDSSLPTPPDVCTTKPPLLGESPETQNSFLGVKSPVVGVPELRNPRHPHPFKQKDLPLPATLVLPGREPHRYTTIIHQGLLGVADCSSSSSSSSHSLPRPRPLHTHAHTLTHPRAHTHAPDCRRHPSVT